MNINGLPRLLGGRLCCLGVPQGAGDSLGTMAAGSKKGHLFGVGSGRKSHPIECLRTVISPWLTKVERPPGGGWECEVLLCTSELCKWKLLAIFSSN